LNIIKIIIQIDPVSRCHTDKNHELSRLAITNKNAEELLKTVIQKSTVYSNPQNYVHARDTYFNNVMNVFQDKRILFGDRQYKLKFGSVPLE
jgi:hypothetical protein